MSKSGPEDKSFQIPKQLVWEAYRRVKANKGAAGVDGQPMADFEEDLRNNLYRIWLCRVEDYAEWAVLGDCLACWRRWAALMARHNHRPSRKARSASRGR